jgi:poly(A) polymerase
VNASTDPLVRAEVLLRGVKFRMRWDGPDLDDGPLRAWALALPHDLLDRLDRRGEEAWHRLAGLWAQCVPDPMSPALGEAVRRLGTVAAQLHARCERVGR